MLESNDEKINLALAVLSFVRETLSDVKEGPKGIGGIGVFQDRSSPESDKPLDFLDLLTNSTVVITAHLVAIMAMSSQRSNPAIASARWGSAIAAFGDGPTNRETAILCHNLANNIDTTLKFVAQNRALIEATLQGALAAFPQAK